jgi:hypothetical protein
VTAAVNGQALALAGSLVIGLDDLQWADGSSLTLGAVVCWMAGLPVAMLGCLVADGLSNLKLRDPGDENADGDLGKR